MSRALEMMGQAIAGTAAGLWSYLSAAPWGPLGWILALALVLLVLVWIALSRGRRRLRGARPSVIVSLGEILVYEREEDDGAVSLVNELRLTLSNLDAAPVQILELSVGTDRMSAPVTAEVAEMVRPGSSLRFRSRLDKIVGESGVLSLYLYAPGSARRHYRLSAAFDWEPWNGRYKISPLDQKVRPSKRLPSVTGRRQRAQAWHQRATAEEARLAAKRQSAEAKESAQRFAEANGEPPREHSDFPDEF